MLPTQTPTTNPLVVGRLYSCAWCVASPKSHFSAIGRSLRSARSLVKGSGRSLADPYISFEATTRSLRSARSFEKGSGRSLADPSIAHLSLGRSLRSADPLCKALADPRPILVENFGIVYKGCRGVSRDTKFLKYW